jgi:hypothetical protein
LYLLLGYWDIQSVYFAVEWISSCDFHILCPFV